MATADAQAITCSCLHFLLFLLFFLLPTIIPTINFNTTPTLHQTKSPSKMPDNTSTLQSYIDSVSHVLPPFHRCTNADFLPSSGQRLRSASSRLSYWQQR